MYPAIAIALLILLFLSLPELRSLSCVCKCVSVQMCVNICEFPLSHPKRHQSVFYSRIFRFSTSTPHSSLLTLFPIHSPPGYTCVRRGGGRRWLRYGRHPATSLRVHAPIQSTIVRSLRVESFSFSPPTTSFTLRIFSNASSFTSSTELFYFFFTLTNFTQYFY